MGSADDNVGLALAWLEAWARGDAEAVSSALDPAVEIHSPPEVGNAGTYRGVAGYRRWEGLWLEAWEDFQNEILRAEPVGQRHVVVDANQRARGRGSGVEVASRSACCARSATAGWCASTSTPPTSRALAVAREGDRA